MRRKRKGERGGFTMVVRGVLCAALLSVPAGCGLDDKACKSLRAQAYEIINEPHTCNDDLDCLGSEWPGCTKPLSKKNRARVAPLRKQFEEGKCVEPENECREPPEIYCKQGLCVFNEKSIK